MNAILGMNPVDLSLHDICEEITDIKKDIRVIEDYEAGIITLGELFRETTFHPSKKQELNAAIDTLRILKATKKSGNG